MKAKVETRQLAVPCETRREGQQAYVDGRIPYESLSLDMGGWREKIQRGAFTQTLKAGTDVLALWNHDTSEILGSTKAGTLNLEDQGDALTFSIRMPSSSASRLETLERRDSTSVSFGFTVDPKGDEWDLSGPETIRTLRSVHLLEVSVGLAWAAYPEAHAEAATRSKPEASGTLDAMRAEIEFYSL